jgi:ketopantoate reductase
VAEQAKHTQTEVLWLVQTPVVSSFSSTHHPHLKIVSGLDEALQADPACILMAMPGWAVGEAAFALLQHLSPSKTPKLLSLAPGIGPTEKLRNYFGEENVLRGVIWPSVDGSPIAGMTIGQHLWLDEILPWLRTLLNRVEVAEESSLAWSEVFWSIQANALAAVMDVDPAQIYRDKKLWVIERAQLREALRVIKNLKINLIPLGDIPVPHLARITKFAPSGLARRWWAGNLSHHPCPISLRNELQSQVGRSSAAYLNGAIAQVAYNAGLSAPVNHALAVSVTDIAEGRAVWEQFRTQPDMLQTIIRIMSRH